MEIPQAKYFELHVTIEPVFEERRATFERLAAKYGFKVADLLLWKDRAVTAERSNVDAFCTGRTATYEQGNERVRALVQELQAAGIGVWRFKIEAVLLDTRLKPARTVWAPANLQSVL